VLSTSTDVKPCEINLVDANFRFTHTGVMSFVISYAAHIVTDMRT